MTDRREALEIAKAIVEAPSRSMAKRLNYVHELTLATNLIAAEAEVEQLKLSNDNLKKVVAFWWPLLGYSSFNEACYLPLEDHRAKTAPVFTELLAARKALEAIKHACRNETLTFASRCTEADRIAAATLSYESHKK